MTIKEKNNAEDQPYLLKNVRGVVQGKLAKNDDCELCGGEGRLYRDDEQGRSFVNVCECIKSQKRLRILNEAGTPGGGGNQPVQREIKIEGSYLEIYNERVRDLLRPRERTRGGKKKWDVGTVDQEFLTLRVRHHPLQGPYVEGLKKLEVTTWLDCVKLIRQGNFHSPLVVLIPSF